ncbi:MAG: hypothetical protein Unbinned4120contig1000_6 [Prokaryotic dsDNA virus sp.]|jgi:Kef-type K+ transport system membrane component KefB|nr:MAG: hypothetical protein Unbinned4120contig1000_6 [Prokaryotic dsDNA virus sp.]|tara:strand:- start:71850 stop:72080 length:231 start_codon:yes stop_codon:yes gene_type:complete
MRITQILLVILVLLILGITAVGTLTAVFHLIAPYAAFLIVMLCIGWILLNWIRKYTDYDWSEPQESDENKDDQSTS